MIVVYGQTNAVLKNMEKMEKVLPPSVAAGLMDKIEHASDPGIRSTRYFKSRMGSLRTFYITLMLVGSGLALILSIAAARETTRPIRILQTVAERVRQGHYDQPVRLVTNDELSELGSAINTMMQAIVGHIKAVESVVDSLRVGIRRMDETANTVLAISAEQSSGATEQASTVQETGSIAEEIVTTARQISERARLVDEVAEKTLTACQDGDQKLEEARAGFKGIEQQVEVIEESTRRIEDRFQEIYKIMGWMEDIAEQTELLALNAALEAAGAGEQGLRFSVVAVSLKKLAIRAAEAAKEIRALIENIQSATVESTRVAMGGREKVAAGGNAIMAVVESLKNISSFAGSTTSAVREISLSTNQQTNASEQLASSISEVQKVARQVEEGAKEIEASIAELRDFSEGLRTTVEKSSGDDLS
jgi:methyl-accepting chemotaxis protein